MTVVRGLTRQDRRMLEDERRALRAALSERRPEWFGVIEWAQDRAAIRSRLREIDEEMAA